jgi:hypothetical protein
MFEHWSRPLLPTAAFLVRLVRHIGLALVIVAGALGVGVLGYHGFEGMSWIDATVNAAMILGGMGPVSPLHTYGGKLFAACYALFSGLLFIVVIGVAFAPVVHRFFHRFHMTPESSEGGDG